MRKTGSTGNLFNIDQNSSSKASLRPVTSMRQHKYRKTSTYLPYSLNNLEMDSYNSVNNYNYDHILLNKTSKQLYEGLMSLKKKVNFLNEEISLAKSEQRKKDVQLSLKNPLLREITKLLNLQYPKFLCLMFFEHRFRYRYCNHSP